MAVVSGDRGILCVIACAQYTSSALTTESDKLAPVDVNSVCYTAIL